MNELEKSMEQLDELLPDEMSEAQLQTLFHMLAKIYGIEGRRLERFLTRMAKTCRRVEKNLEFERQRLVRAPAE